MARDYNSAEFQKFLDEQQYSRNGILRYEKIFGEDFVSTGGITTTKVVFLIFPVKMTAHVRPSSFTDFTNNTIAFIPISGIRCNAWLKRRFIRS